MYRRYFDKSISYWPAPERSAVPGSWLQRMRTAGRDVASRPGPAAWRERNERTAATPRHAPPGHSGPQHHQHRPQRTQSKARCREITGPNAVVSSRSCIMVRDVVITFKLPHPVPLRKQGALHNLQISVQLRPPPTSARRHCQKNPLFTRQELTSKPPYTLNPTVF